jgi:hypothetical protein
MSKNRLLVAVVAAATLPMALGLAACGGDDDDNGGSSNADEQQITTAITVSAASGDPTACTKYQTQNFVEQTNDGTGQEAIKSCEQDAADSVADSVDISDVEVDGDSATAKAAVTGSIFDGQTLDLGLVKEGGVWKLDKFNGFEDFDKAKIIAGFKAEIAKDPSVPPAAADCVAQQMEKTSDEDLEGFFTEQNAQSEDQLFKPCESQFQGQ